MGFISPNTAFQHPTNASLDTEIPVSLRLGTDLYGANVLPNYYHFRRIHLCTILY